MTLKLTFTIIAVFLLSGFTTNTVTLQIEENRVELAAKNVNGIKYFRQAAIARALNLKQTGHYFISLREVARVHGFRLNWIGTRNTIIIETNNLRLTGSQSHRPVFTAKPLPQEIAELIRGSSLPYYASINYDSLRYLTVSHVDFYGVRRTGNMIVAAKIADEVLDIFREIYEYRFPIARMRLIDFYGTEDYLSMSDNNSVAFNYRYIAGTRVLSRHALGMAIDINPIQNPYIRGDTIWPPAGRAYMDRSYIRPGMITRGCVVYRAFTSRGWTWGGTWPSPRDYHHFERR